MNLSEPFLRRPIGTTLLTIGLALAGIAAFFNLPVSPLPQFDFPTITVRASLPGASPETMAANVATPLERRLGHIADVSEMTSQSSTGSTNITLQFNLDRDIDGAARDVQAAINASRVDLPATLRSNPTYQKVNPSDAPIMVIAMTSETKSRAQIYDAAATIIQQQLAQLKGVGDVTIGGAAAPAVRVEMNPLALAKYGISPEDVRAALSSANANRPKGVIEGPERRWQIYTNDTGKVAADFAPLVVAFRNGSAVRLSDVATVRDGQEDVHNMGLFNGQSAVVVQITRQPNANIIATVEEIKKVLPHLESQLPQDIKVDIAVDRTTSIRASINDVERTLVLSIFLVVAVVFLFLRDGRATFIPAVAVTVSLLGTLGVMLLAGFSLDNLSLMALTVATGFVVDDAIVVLENTARHVEAGMPRYKAALRGAREVGFTVLSISVSLVAVFIPILLMGGIIGRLFREFAITLSTAIGVSLIISLTTTPMMCAFLLGRGARDPKAKPKPEPRWSRWLRKGFDGMTSGYERLLLWALDNGPVVLVILICAIVLNVYLFTIVPKGFFPTQDTGQLVGGMQSDQSTSFRLTQQRVKRFADILAADPAIDPLPAGEKADPKHPHGTVTAFVGGRGSGGFFFIQLKPKADRDGASGQDVANRLRGKLSRVSGASLFLTPVQDLRIGGRGGNGAYQYTLQAEDRDQLRTWATKLTDKLKEDDSVLTDVNSDQEDHGLSSYLRIDRDTASRLGITPAQIDNALYDAFGQRQAAVIYNPLNQYHVVMEVDPSFAQNPTGLSDVYVNTGAAPSDAAGSSQIPGTGSPTPRVVGAPATNFTTLISGGSTPVLGFGAPASNLTSIVAGGTATAQSSGTGPAPPPTRAASTGTAISSTPERVAPLSAFAHWELSASPTSVRHQDTSLATTISFSLAPGKSLSDAVTAIREGEAAIGMPITVHGSFQGTAKVFQDSLANEPVLILAAILAVYIVLGVLYESYIHPWTVLSTLPSAGLGAVLALIVFKSEFSIIAMIGVVLLIGIVKKNAILIIDFALEAERSQGLSTRDAVYQASLLRFRPILMTTLAAMLGALPLAIGWGEGSELRRPLGITIIGGLLVSQILTLVTTPVVYLYLDRFRRRPADESHLSRSGPTSSPQPAPAE
ncbi:MAG: efflux RND transporter permease subunit [Proteobacteria bacterium]|nr:efflux RND transporter permease subunit [Pseudomonadota bacterium]